MKKLLPVLIGVLLAIGVVAMVRNTRQTEPELEIPAALSEVIPDTESLSDTSLEEASGERDCLQGEVPGEIDEEFLIGKAFVNYERDGEQGVFQSNGVLLTNWFDPVTETEYTDNEAQWGVVDYELSIRHSSATDGVLGGFRFYQFEGNTFAIPEGDRWIFIGPDQESIGRFFDAKYMMEICRA